MEQVDIYDYPDFIGKICECGKPLEAGVDDRDGYRGNQCFMCRQICGICEKATQLEYWIKSDGKKYRVTLDETLTDDTHYISVCPECGTITGYICPDCNFNFGLDDEYCNCDN